MDPDLGSENSPYGSGNSPFGSKSGSGNKGENPISIFSPKFNFSNKKIIKNARKVQIKKKM